MKWNINNHCHVDDTVVITMHFLSHGLHCRFFWFAYKHKDMQICNNQQCCDAKGEIKTRIKPKRKTLNKNPWFLEWITFLSFNTDARAELSTQLQKKITNSIYTPIDECFISSKIYALYLRTMKERKLQFPSPDIRRKN